MRTLVACVFILSLSGCAFMNHQGPLTLGGRWYERIPPEPEVSPEENLVVRAQSAAKTTERSLAATLAITELVFVRAPVFVVSSVVLEPFGMTTELKPPKPPRSKTLLSTFSPDGEFRFYASSRPCPSNSDENASTVELTIRIVPVGERRELAEQRFRILSDVTFENAQPVWDFASSLVTVRSDDGRTFRIYYSPTEIRSQSNNGMQATPKPGR